MTTSNVRVRIAPSNTGPDVHVGNVRTALYNYLFAKKCKGTFVFRIENSDLARSKDEYADAIAATFDWLGLRADEGYRIGGDFGPYMQTQKLERYKSAADELVEKGLAYRCYCTPDELDALRNALPEKQRITFRYPGICRDRKDYPANKDYVIRLKAPTEGSVEWDDLVFGKIVVPNKENFDWVLIRSNGIPLYNWGCCIDDLDQKITHIIRGRDHIINTNIQILIHNVLGSHDIKYGHLPLMLGQDGSKLSKRHCSVATSQYKNAGYSPGAILNYLSKFGFGIGDAEVFNLDFLTEHFKLENCKRSDGKFDPIKFATINYSHLKSEQLTSDDDYIKYLQPFLQAQNVKLTDAQLLPYVPVIRTRAKTFVEATDLIMPMLTEVQPSPELVAKTYTQQNTAYLEALRILLRNLDNWSEETLRTSVQGWLAEQQLTLREIGAPLRIALLGTPNSPEIFQVLNAMGKTTTINRLNRTIAKCQQKEVQ